MEKVAKRVDDLIGKTPLLELCRIEEKHALGARLLVKLERVNPAGSVKDRVAKSILDDAERSGRLKPGGTVIEPTSGNTGIGLAALCAARGYRLIVVMPETMSAERRKLIAAYGAELVLTPGASGMRGAIAQAEELHAQIENSLIAGQFFNPANPQAHFETTGPEIWEDTGGKVDLFVSGVGTGGTLTGAGKFLKSKNQLLRLIAVEPKTSAVLSGKAAGAHKIQGIGAGFVPEVLDPTVIDEIVCVSDEDAFAAARELAVCEGVLCGISSGAALCAAIEIAGRAENARKTVVALLPDTGDRYLSADLFGST